MATNPIDEEPQPTRAQRVVRAVVAPVTEPKTRLAALLALAGALATLAPVPFGAISSAALILVAYDAGRKR